MAISAPDSQPFLPPIGAGAPGGAVTPNPPPSVPPANQPPARSTPIMPVSNHAFSGTMPAPTLPPATPVATHPPFAGTMPTPTAPTPSQPLPPLTSGAAAIPVTAGRYRVPEGYDPTGRNNPGNIKLADGSGFQSFKTPQAGIQAIRQNLLAYQDQHGLTTIAGIINRWAPPSENDTPTLIRNAARRMGIGENDKIDLHDPATMDKMVRAIVAQEQGDSVAAMVDDTTGPQQYVPASQMGPQVAERPANQWGWEPQGGYGDLPTPQQYPSLLQGLMPIIGLLSGRSGIAAVGVMNMYSGYIKGRQQGQLFATKLAQEQFSLQVAQHDEQMKEENQAIGEAMAIDPDGTKGPLMDVANKYHDSVLAQAISMGSDTVQKLMQARDRYNTDLSKLNLALEKERTQLQLEQLKLQHEMELDPLKKQELEARIKLIEAQTKKAESTAGAVNPYTTDGTGAAPDTAPSTADPTQTGDTGSDTGGGTTGGDAGTTTDTGDTTTGAATPTGASTATAQATPPAAQDLPPRTQLVAAAVSDAVNDPTRAAAQAAAQSRRPPQYQADPNAKPTQMGPAMRHLNATGQEIARQFLEGGEGMLRMIEPKFRAPIVAGAAELATQLRNIPKDLSGQDVLDAVNNIDPRLGMTLDRMLRNKAGVPSGARAASPQTAAFWDNMINLATQADSHWSPQQFATLQSVRKDFADGQQGKTLTRSFRLAQLAKQLWDDAATMPAGPVPLNEIQRWFESGVAGDPKYTKFALDWHNFAIESQAVVTGGQPYASLSRIVLDTMQRGANPRQIRQAIQSDLTASLGAIDATMSQWRQTFPEEGNPGSYNQRGYNALWQIYHGSIDTGAMGDGLPPVGSKSDDGITYLGGDPNDPLNRRQ